MNGLIYMQSNGKLEGVVTVTELAQWIDWANCTSALDQLGKRELCVHSTHRPASQGCIFPTDINANTL